MSVAVCVATCNLYETCMQPPEVTILETSGGYRRSLEVYVLKPLQKLHATYVEVTFSCNICSGCSRYVEVYSLQLPKMLYATYIEIYHCGGFAPVNLHGGCRMSAEVWTLFVYRPSSRICALQLK